MTYYLISYGVSESDSQHLHLAIIKTEADESRAEQAARLILSGLYCGLKESGETYWEYEDYTVYWHGFERIDDVEREILSNRAGADHYELLLTGVILLDDEVWEPHT